MTTDLQIYATALSRMFSQVNGLVRDADAGPGWSALLDIDRCPTSALPWLAQIVGVTLPADASDSLMRATTRNTGGFRRGTLASIRGAAQALMTSATPGVEPTVFIEERTGSAYQLTVITYTSETPDADAVEAAIRAQKPAGLILTYETVTGQIWLQLLTNHPTWQDVLDDYTTWRDVRDDTP